MSIKRFHISFLLSPPYRENHRLRMLTRSNRLSMMHFQISIPKAILRTPVSGRRREHYCYEIRISPNGTADGGHHQPESWSVFRRYSEFYRLHKRLQKEYPSVRTLDFPPKKKIGNMVSSCWKLVTRAGSRSLLWRLGRY